MIKKLISLFLFILIAINCGSEVAPQEVSPGWHTDNLNLTWLEQYYPSFYDLEYQIYIMDIYNPGEYTILGRTEERIYSFLPENEGDFLLGVNAIKVFNDQDVLEGPTCWSDDPSCVQSEDVFYLRVETIGRGKNDPITRWKIMWK